jgi:hypothetical protein
VIGLGNGRLLQPGALRCNAAITRSSIGLVVAAGYAGGFQSPPIVTTLAACAANASETEHSLTIPWARERRCENGPEPIALRNFLFWIWLSSSPEHLSTLAALGKMFKRSLQPFRTASNLIIHEPPAFRLYQEQVETLARAGGTFRTLGAPFSHVADSGLWTMLRCGPSPS